jgi:hypothetical protein
MEESAELGLSGGRDYKSKNRRINMERSVQLYWFPIFGIYPMKKCPHVRLRAFASDKYDALE